MIGVWQQLKDSEIMKLEEEADRQQEEGYNRWVEQYQNALNNGDVALQEQLIEDGK